MPRLTNSAPKYRKHRASGQAIVTLDGRDFYLGPHGTRANRREYDRLVAEWMQNGRQIPIAQSNDLTVTELASAYWRFAKGYYQKNGRPTNTAGIKIALRFLRGLYGHTPAAEFGPLAFKAVRQAMIDNGQSRVYINQNADHIKRMFKWAAGEQLLPASVSQSMSMVSGLKKGRAEARETAPITPVDDAAVETTLLHLPVVVADMVRFQRLTGCRPAEVCLARPCDVDTGGDVWEYRPESHKTEHHNRARVIFIGPQGQDILRPYLLRPAESYCFSPIDSEKKRRAEQYEKRTTPLAHGNRPGTSRKRRPKRTAGNRYDAASYRRAIYRACKKAGVEQWSPNRLRHSAATEIRRRFGLEAAKVALGHAAADVTQVYADRDYAKSAEVMRQIG